MTPDSIGEFRLPRWGKWMVGVAAGLVVAALAFAVFEPIQVLPRIRLAPGYTLTDQSGATMTSEDARGAVTLYTFAYGECGDECESLLSTAAEVSERVGREIDLGETDFRVVTISFDPERDAGRLAEVATASGADGDRWVWATGEAERLRTVIGSGFKTYYEQLADGSFRFDPAFVVVDGWGVIRGEYRYQTLADDADKLVRHVGILADELRNSGGVASLAYEAAHLFLCYP